jgi:hypothetical protein
MLWVGDRWGSAPDTLFSHTRQFWGPLSYDDSAVPPTIAPLHWIDAFTIDVAVGCADGSCT